MKTLNLFILIAIFSINLKSQNITIDNNDMTVPNIYTISKISSINFDPNNTGQDYFWDFSTMQYETQVNDTFFSVSDAPYVYQAVYNNFLDPDHKATVVQNTGAITNMITVVQITDNYDYFKNSNSRYVKVGTGSTINGVPTAMKYDNVEIVVGNFPLQINDTTSSVSVTGTNIPNIGYYGQTIRRTNIIDGFGTLTTPYGTFETVRTKSIINIRDTLYYDSYSYGIAFDRPELTECNWYADNQYIPLLTIKGSNNSFSASYKDSLHTTSVSEIINNETKFKVYPTICSDILNIEFNNNGSDNANIKIFSETGKLIIDEQYGIVLGKNHKTISLQNKIKNKGFYFVVCTIGENVNIKKIIFNKN